MKYNIYTYLLCVIAGLTFMSQYKFTDSVQLSGDEIDYQSLAVNSVYGHGFPVSGAMEDSAAYKFYYFPGMLYGRPWSAVGTGFKGLNFYRNPAYPYFVSIVYRAFSVKPAILYKLQFLLLILFGSLIPFICYRLFGEKGRWIGMLSYILFLFFDKHYAFNVMCEPLIIVYLITLLLLSVVLKYRYQVTHAFIAGSMLGLGLLLKNCFFPLVLFVFAVAVYQAFISRKIMRKIAMALVAGAVITILPWTIYANYQLSKTGSDKPFILINTQGDDVLLGANNEFAADGLWHPEWQNDPHSLYNTPGIKNYSALHKLIAFYYRHPLWIPRFFTSKIMMGLFATVPQVLFYLSALAFVVFYKSRKKFLPLAMIACTLIALLFLHEPIRSFLTGVSNSVLNTHNLLRYVLLAITVYTLWIYFNIVQKEKIFTGQILFLLLANFALLTLIFYGNNRITGVVDFVFLICTFHNLFQIIETP